MGQDASTLPTQEIVFDPANMLALTRKLSSILEEEVSLLQSMKIAQIHKFYDDKIALVSILETYKGMLTQNPDLINNIPDRVRTQLREESIRFERLAEEDGKQIERAKEVHKLVMEAIKRAIEKKISMNTGYNKQGIVYAEGSNSFVPPSVSINENI